MSALPRPDMERLLIAARRQRVGPHQVLFEAGEPATGIFFPERGTVITSVHVFSSGERVDAAIVGDEGLVGIEAITGAPEWTSRAVVQSIGAVWRVDATVVREVIRTRERLNDRVLKFVQAMIVQLSFTAACNRAHDLQQRLARLLLFLRDRSGNDEIRFTHDALAQMAGARRAGVTLALGDLETGGVLDRGRNRIRLRDTAALERASCECYGKISATYRRLLG